MAETIWITRANRGIGLALTKLSLIKNLNIEACFRDKKKSEELQELSLEHPNLNIHEMDVTNSESIKKISQNINFKVDILVCNAGVNNGKGNIFSKEHNEQAIMDVMMANVAGPFLTIKNFYENLNVNHGAKIAIISSLMGSQQHSSSNAPIYRASKAAANNLMRTISNQFINDNVIVASFHPGWVRTDMGGSLADISPEESAEGLMKQFLNLKSNDTGKFFNYDGSVLPL